MKLERKKLLAALEPLKPALAYPLTEAHSQVWFDKKYAYAHDGGFGVRVVLEIPFEFGVLGKLLLGLLEQSEAEEVSLEPKDENFTFKAGRSSVKLPIRDTSRRPKFYPDKPKGKPVAEFVLSKEFVAGLRRVFMLHPANPKRLEHHGVCVFPFDDGAELELYTTDSKAIAVIPVKQKASVKTVLPRLFAEQMVSQCAENAELEMYEDHFRVEATKQVMLYSNVLDTSAMQNLPAVVDRAYDTKTAPPFAIPKGFQEALERATLMAGSKEDGLVELKTTGKKLVMSGTFQAGEFLEEFDVDKSLPNRAVSVLAKPLMTTAAVTTLMVGENAVTLCGKDDFLYFLALGK